MSAATGEPVGTAAEEAERLLESLGGWFEARTRPSGAPDDAADRPESAEEAERPHGATCRSCPLCRGVAYLQETHPEVLTHLAGAAQHLVAALRSLAVPPAEGAGSAQQASGSPAAPDGDRPSRAVRIVVEPEPEAAEDRANSATEQEQAP